MTELSPSARESAERYSPEVKAKVNEAAKEIAGYANECCYRSDGFESHIEELASDAIYEVLAGVSYQARDSEGKGEAGDVVKNDRIEQLAIMLADAREFIRIYSRTGRRQKMIERIQACLDLHAPPAPKDERVERLVQAAKQVHQQIEWEGPTLNTRIAVSTRRSFEELAEALRAFGDGKAEGGR